MRSYVYIVAVAGYVVVSLAILVSHFGTTADNAPPSSSAAVFSSFQFVTEQPKKRICLAADDDETGEDSYTCTTRGAQMQLEREREPPYELGVPQRIEGSDTEKGSIQEVISMMQNYFVDEVLAKPAYKDVRRNWCVSEIFVSPESNGRSSCQWCTADVRCELLHSPAFSILVLLFSFKIYYSKNNYDLCAFWAGE